MELIWALINKYSMNSDEVSLFELEHDLADFICLMIPRLLAVLGTLLHRGGRYASLITCLSSFLRTSKGLEYTLSSPTVLPQCLRGLRHEEDDACPADVLATLRALRFLSLCSDDIRLFLVNLGAMEMICVVLQKSSKLNVQTEGSHFLMDLATLNAQSGSIFNDLIRRLLLTPNLCTKHAAVLMLSYVYESHGVDMCFRDWSHELHVELCRLLLCSTLTYQYDTATLVSYLLSESDIGPLLVKTCTAVLCLRYIPGGAPLLSPGSASEYAYPELRDNPNNVFETLEVCTVMLCGCNAYPHTV